MVECLVVVFEEANDDMLLHMKLCEDCLMTVNRLDANEPLWFFCFGWSMDYGGSRLLSGRGEEDKAFFKEEMPPLGSIRAWCSDSQAWQQRIQEKLQAHR